jgi:very-short-patch-repair endonuclease
MSASEQVLWLEIRKDKLGYRFRRGVSVGPYCLDFYCALAQLNVEVDGEQHQYRTERDRARDEYLLGCGIETLRIPSMDLFDSSGVRLAYWVKRISERCDEKVEQFRGDFPGARRYCAEQED